VADCFSQTWLAAVAVCGVMKCATDGSEGPGWEATGVNVRTHAWPAKCAEAAALRRRQ
jgi:hypothetical protein